MEACYANWAYDDQFDRIISRDLQKEVGGYVLRHPDDVLLALANVRAEGSNLSTMESLGELFCQMDDLVDFRAAYAGKPTRPGTPAHAAPEVAE